MVARKPDLLSRCLVILTEQIMKDKRRKIEDIWNEFEELRPKLLGYILDILVKVIQTMRENGSIKFRELPRMADFAAYAELVSRCLGNEDNKFMEAFNGNVKVQAEHVIESNTVALCVNKLMDNVFWPAILGRYVGSSRLPTYIESLSRRDTIS
jgi:hypothetical protein